MTSCEKWFRIVKDGESSGFNIHCDFMTNGHHYCLSTLKMFLGRHITSFQGKNRLVLAKKFRDELNKEDRFYIIMGDNGEIWGYKVKNWLEEAQIRRSLPLEDSDGRKARRAFFSRTEECQLDSQGRFIIPQEFVDYAELGDEILMVGAGDYFEIWNKDKFEQMIDSNKIPL